MSKTQPMLTAEQYERAAGEYLASLPLEHFMEATPQATQREITVESLALLRTLRGGFRLFNELLVQYFFEGNLRRVVPDNMVVLGELDDRPRTSYATELEPCPPLWVLEYVSAANERKDYVGSFAKYERQLRVPYYLIFDPDTQDLRLYRHDGTSYQRTPAGPEGRYAVPELDLEMGLRNGWVRYWYRGELLELPAELQKRLVEAHRRLDEQGERIHKQDEHIHELKIQVDSQASQLQLLDRHLRERDEQLRHREKQLREHEEREREREERERAGAQQLAAIAGALRPLVEVRARQAGRQDILEQLPATTDGQLLTRWLTELS